MNQTGKRYVLMLIGVLIFVASYFLVYLPLSEKTDALSSEISALEGRLESLKEHSAKVGDYKSAIAEDKAAVERMMSRYDADERPEDFIMLAVGLEEDVGLTVESLSFSGASPVCAISGVEDPGDGEKPVSQVEMTACKRSSTISGLMSYSQMKSMLDYLASRRDLTKLDSLSLSYDSSTGQIRGEIVVDKYFIARPGVVEPPAAIPYTELGRSVLFGG